MTEKKRKKKEGSCGTRARPLITVIQIVSSLFGELSTTHRLFVLFRLFFFFVVCFLDALKVIFQPIVTTTMLPQHYFDATPIPCNF